VTSISGARGVCVQLASQAGQDSRLSLRARGLIYFVLSLPPEQAGQLTAQRIAENVPEGRDAVRSALAELERYGYSRRTRARDGKGRWQWEQVISDAPIDSQPGPEST
jgi:hypothetical protein